ncbi:MAG: alpha/beta hydrolase [Chitinimonas sp.]|nr:alpha/beta hydrolase [Chitinimonas sp.]
MLRAANGRRAPTTPPGFAGTYLESTMLNRAITPLLITLGLLTQAPALASTAPRPYTLEHTEVRSVPSRILPRDYEIFVSVPDSYHKTQKRYPVLFMTDANYAFPLVRSINRRVNDYGRNLDEVILVGLSYAKGDSPITSRNRDYTPTDIVLKKTRRPSQADGPYGQAESYGRFVSEEVIPFVAQHYRADMSKKIYVGHSYGSLLGLHLLFRKPDTFDYYVLGSPSLWYDRYHMLDVERQYAANNKNLSARVLMVAGAFEAIQPGSDNPRYAKEIDMVKDMQRFEQQLKGRGYPGLSIRSEVIKDEDHLTVFPALITRGLLWALPKR